MKKLIFTLICLVAMTGLTSKVMAQGPYTPYAGGTYTYSVAGLDNAGENMKVKIRFSKDAGTTFLTMYSQATVGANDGIAVWGTAITNNGGSTTHTASTTLEDSNTSQPISVTGTTAGTAETLTFNITYGTGVTTAPATTYSVWVEVIDMGSGTEDCLNRRFIEVTPAADNLDFVVLAEDPSAAGTFGASYSTCPTEVAPTFTLTPFAQTDAVADQTVLKYKVTRSGGNDAYDWAFTVSETFGALATWTNVVVTANSAAVTAETNGTPDTSDDREYRIVSTTGTPVNEAILTLTITNAPGSTEQSFVSAITSMKQYIKQTDTVNSESNTDTTNDTATLTLKRVPAVGTFSAN